MTSTREEESLDFKAPENGFGLGFLPATRSRFSHHVVQYCFGKEIAISGFNSPSIYEVLWPDWTNMMKDFWIP